MKITYAEVQQLRAALLTLDGNCSGVKTAQGMQIVKKHYEFEEGARAAIARNLAMVSRHSRICESQHLALKKTYTNGTGKVPKEKEAEFQEKEADLLSVQVEFTPMPLTIADFKLGENKLQPSTLAVLIDYLVPDNTQRTTA